jgi:hypothetical protein
VTELLFFGDKTHKFLFFNPANPNNRITRIDTASGSYLNWKILQALHSFLHDLFQAAHSADSSGKAGSTANAAGNSSAGKRYGELASKIDGLAQQLNSGSGSDTSNKLKSSFDNLVKALNNGSTSGKTSTAGNAPNLQDFLHELSRNLQGGALNPLGSLVSTAA